MTELADWCAFFGAWMLFAGPVYQAETELDAEMREAESVVTKARTMPGPKRISKWWWLLPPAAWLKHQVLRPMNPSVWMQLAVGFQYRFVEAEHLDVFPAAMLGVDRGG